MSKEKKLAKKEAKAAKREANAEKALAKANAVAEKKHAKAYEKFVKKTTKKNGADAAIPTIDEFQTKKEIKAEIAAHKAYEKLVKNIDKKNAKLEKKCAKKGTPFVPIATPAEDEMTAKPENKAGKIVLIIILVLLIWFLIYFMVRFAGFVYNPFQPTTETTTAGVVQEYETYSNPHEITTTPDYSIAEAKLLLKQTIHDNWKEIGYSSDVSSNAITYSNKVVTVNGADCFVFSCEGKTFAVAVKLSAVYYAHNGEYEPLSFNNTNYLFN